MQAELAARQFSVKLIRFIHYLRRQGFQVATGETIDAFRALEQLDLLNETDVRLGLRTVLCSTHAEREAFETLFDAFFWDLQLQHVPGSPDDEQYAPKKQKQNRAEKEGQDFTSNKDSANEILNEQSDQSGHTELNSTQKEYSFLQAVRQSQTEMKQLSNVQVASDAFEQMLTAVRVLIKNIQLRPSRRWYPMPQGKRIDLRRTLRRSISTGGWPIEPARTAHRPQKAHFVLLCDGSRSMAPYSGLFLQFAYALYRETQSAELFLFSTSIRRVTPLLRMVRPPRMPSFTQLGGAEWGGGTRIGKSFTEVAQRDGLRMFHGQTVVIVFSDGLDSGDPEELVQAMRVLKRRVHRIVWLNPLAVQPGYEPIARSMNAALPYIDLFAEAHNASSFLQLAQQIGMRRGSIA